MAFNEQSKFIENHPQNNYINILCCKNKLMMDPQSSSSSSSCQLSSGSHEVSSKRLKLDTLNLPSLSNSSNDSGLNIETEYKRMETKFTNLRARLSKSEGTVAQLHRIRSEIEEVFEQERRMQQWQMNVDTEIIDQLQVALNEATKNTDEALDAKTSVEVEFSETKAKMREEISALLMENARLKDTNSHKPEKSVKYVENIESLKKLQIAEKRIAYLEEKLEDNAISQMEFDILSVELKQLTNNRFNSEKKAGVEKNQLLTRVHQLESELQFCKNIISTLAEEIQLLRERVPETPATFEQQLPMEQETGAKEISHFEEAHAYYSMQEANGCYLLVLEADPQTSEIYERPEDNGEPEKIAEDVNNGGFDIVITGNSADLTDNVVMKNYSIKSESGDVKNNVKMVSPESTQKSREIMVGNYPILISNEKFFSVDWMNEYIDDGNQYICRRCGKSEANRMNIEDHVWVIHYQENFECPTCSADDCPCSLKRRESLIKHMESVHPHLLQYE